MPIYNLPPQASKPLESHYRNLARILVQAMDAGSLAGHYSTIIDHTVEIGKVLYCHCNDITEELKVIHANLGIVPDNDIRLLIDVVLGSGCTLDKYTVNVIVDYCANMVGTLVPHDAGWFTKVTLELERSYYQHVIDHLTAR